MGTLKQSHRQPRLFALRRQGLEVPKIDDMLHMLPESYPGFPLPKTEYYFAKAMGRQWRFDYAWDGYRVSLEVEGGIFGRQITDVEGQVHRVVQSRHTDPIGMAEDCRKYNAAAILGWLVLRATDHTIRDRTILNDIVAAMRARGWRDGDKQ